jgi:ribosomal protein L9
MTGSSCLLTPPLLFSPFQISFLAKSIYGGIPTSGSTRELEEALAQAKAKKADAERHAREVEESLKATEGLREEAEKLWKKVEDEAT